MALRPAAQMRVRIDKARHQDLAAEVEHVGRLVLLEQLLATDRDNVAAVDRYRRCDRQVGIDRNHLAVMQDRVDFDTVVHGGFAARQQAKTENEQKEIFRHGSLRASQAAVALRACMPPVTLSVMIR